MATNHNELEDSDDAQLAWLLSSSHDAPPMRSEFISALNERLAAEFEARRRNGRNGEAIGARDGVSDSAAIEAAFSDASASAFLSECENKAPSLAALPKTSRKRRRWMAWCATAAGLVLVVAMLSDPPAWAAALRALVHSIRDFRIGDHDGAAAQSDAPDAGVAIRADEAVVAPTPAQTDVAGGQIRPAEAPIAQSDEKTTQALDPPHVVAEAPKWEPFDAPMAEEELSQRVDAGLAAVWQANGIRPVGPATDAEFMRRVYLDLTGRIPSVTEARVFLEDAAPDRRQMLVEWLLEHRDHATHLAAVWRGILLPSEADLSRLGGATSFEEWLAERFAQHIAYDQIVSELLLAEGRVAESGPLLFYAAHKLNPEELAARTSRAFLGVRMECAQCHDHFFDEEISQNDFWSFAAFFARISRPLGKMEMTSPVLAVRDNQHGDITIPDTNEVVAPRLPDSALTIVDEAEGPSRREQLVDWLTAKNNGQFARATVNRTWSLLFGRGLVEPVDDMRPDNLPIAPDVLETLARDFAASDFDLRRLLRALVLTDAYQLSSRSEENDPSPALHFAQMNIKSLTAEQLYDCIAVATRQGELVNTPVDETGLLRFSDVSRQAFVEKFRAPAGQATDYHAGIPQALTMMHGGLIHSATDVATSGLLKSLAAPFFTNDQRLDALFLSTLSRYPTDVERELMLRQVAAASGEVERQQALGDILWALLNSAEFTFNH
jgi:hypothetical protein